MATQRKSSLLFNGDSLVLPKTSGVGVKVDEAAPTFGWRDLLGNVTPKAAGAGAPTRTVYRGGTIGQYSFALNDLFDSEFHLPHDYLPGSDLYWHLHWSHNGTGITGNVVFTCYATYAKGYNQAAFPAEIAPTITYNTVDIATTPQYQHRIDEIQLSTPGGAAALLNTTNLEVDGVILITTKVTTLPTITAGNLFVHYADLHYQSNGVMGTKQRTGPAFYT